jgi:hypothetical protein
VGARFVITAFITSSAGRAVVGGRSASTESCEDCAGGLWWELLLQARQVQGGLWWWGGVLQALKVEKPVQGGGLCQAVIGQRPCCSRCCY